MGERGRERRRFSDILRGALELDGDISKWGYSVEVRGRGSVIIGGAGRILDYTPKVIRVGVRDGAVSVCGEALCCSAYCAGAVVIEGRICSILFEEGER